MSHLSQASSRSSQSQQQAATWLRSPCLFTYSQQHKVSSSSSCSTLVALFFIAGSLLHGKTLIISAVINLICESICVRKIKFRAKNSCRQEMRSESVSYLQGFSLVEWFQTDFHHITLQSRPCSFDLTQCASNPHICHPLIIYSH